jgi:hypothetical protein
MILDTWDITNNIGLETQVVQFYQKGLSGWGYYIYLKLRLTISTNDIYVTCTFCMMFHSSCHDYNLNIIYTLITVNVNTVQ